MRGDDAAAVLGFLPVLSAEPAQSERRGDFVSTPTIPPEALKGIIGSGKGLLQIEYARGAIRQVKVLETSGLPKLDAVAVRHVKKNYRLRPGASGTAKLPFAVSGDGPKKSPVIPTGRGDFVSTPPFKIPRLKNADGLTVRAFAKITYREGSIIRVEMVKATGNEELDRVIIRHILAGFKVKRNASGVASLPVTVQL